MSSNRAFTLLGVAAAGGVGYYLYNAGGDPKVAQKKFEGMRRPQSVFSTSTESDEQPMPPRSPLR
jgi:hypothetical protein